MRSQPAIDMQSPIVVRQRIVAGGDKLDPEGAIESPVLDCFTYMLGSD